MVLSHDQVLSLRKQFPAFQRRVNGIQAAYFDGPAGTQVPQRVADAISKYLLLYNANHGGLFATSVESDQWLEAAHQAFADFLGVTDPQEVSFGQNMTSLTFAFSRALATEWKPGDEIIVTRLDHDANVTPWVRAAEDRGVTVHFVDFDRESYRLDLQQLRSLLSERTRLVAVGAASNATGGINPVRRISEMAHAVGALCFVDAVHYAPHRLIDVGELGCDFLVCSAYKFFGPHTGILWGRREWMERLPAYKVRPAPDSLPGKWMTGTQSHDCIAGSMEAVEYLADLGRDLAGDYDLARRPALRVAFEAIEEYEQSLADRLLSGFAAIPGLKVYGSTEPGQPDQRVATFSITLDGTDTTYLAQHLCDRGHFVWHGHYYALQFYETLGLAPQGMVRIGALHYNTVEEVDRLLRDLQVMAAPQLA